MLKFANLRKKSFRKSTSIGITEEELDKVPEDDEHILKKFTSQLSSVSRSSQSVFQKLVTRQFTMKKKTTMMSQGLESHRYDNNLGEEV